MLEYYPGILILTTNRVGSFDEAIKSRVHCALYYPPLDKDKTFKVWSMNLDVLEERNKALEPRFQVQFKRNEIEDYARLHWRKGKKPFRWNGRQIKNAFQTAVALADWDTLQYTGGAGNPNGPVLRPEHFEKVATASEHFDMYLERTRRNDHTRAREAMLRDDSILDQFKPIFEPSDSDEEEEEEEEPRKKKKPAVKKKKKVIIKETEFVKAKPAKKAKAKAKVKVKQPEPELSEEEEEEDDEDDEEQEEEDEDEEVEEEEEEEDEEEEEEEEPPPPPKKAVKKKAKAKK